MNINSLYGSLATPGVNATNAVQSTRGGSCDTTAAAASPAASATISTPGQFFSQLEQLSQSDSTQFKQVASQLSANFQKAASQASGPEAKVLGNLANQLGQAAQTGTLSAPHAQPGPQGASSASPGHEAHHHHHHGGGSAASGAAQVQQAMQDAMSIVSAAMQNTGTSATTRATMA